ncbi:MAG: penicillin-binding protein activator LpoB [Magnetococcales bacterium]|nr:penicillin-binding protein activator LpoB [Magnetococcales bacterium]
MTSSNLPITLSTLVLLTLTACGSTSGTNDRGMAPVYNDPSKQGMVSGIGVESHDLVALSQKMVKEMATNHTLMGRKKSPRVILDSKYLRNESSSRINKNLITDRLRINLNNAAAGRIIFIGRHYSDMINKERKLKREGKVDIGSMGMAKKVAGADFRLGGRIVSMDAMQSSSGKSSRFHQFIFEMVELETGAIIWGGMYDFKKTGQDDVIYR